MRLSGARIHLRMIFDEDRSMRHEILNEKSAAIARPQARATAMRLRCDWPLFFIVSSHARQSDASSINCPYSL
ncbi:hypothetical protein Y032_0010g1129 [Ancylostoma ceylanicum]|uniref:Uncharacterized protein n=1 Tax=Ancylostoma ceylanicum TaxID=53326 RepID=A0A016VGG3_9BILA|nr:hypothetical protein Y032_0010g1129 [Ancylostoma ceylanicum]